MKRLGMLCMCGLVAGCVASTPETAASPKPAVQKVSYLTGKTQKQVTRTLGDPAIVREEAPHQLWAYNKNGCATLVFFDGEGVCQHAETRGDCEKSFAWLK